MSSRPASPRSRLRLAPRLAAVATVGAALTLAACGGSSSSSQTTASAGAGGQQGQSGQRRFGPQLTAAQSACLKKEGVTFPNFRGGNGNGGPPAGNGNGAPPAGYGNGGNGGPPAGANGTGGGFRNSGQFQKMQAALTKCGVTLNRPQGQGMPPGQNGTQTTATTKST